MKGPDLKKLIVQHISASPRGMTTRELAECLGETVLRLRPRISELHRAKKIAPHPFRRQTAQVSWYETIWLAPQKDHHHD